MILDRYALLTVLRNLVRNAIEHAAPATLMASLTGDGALALRDDGKGIDEADLPFLFRRYFSGRLRDAGGLGRDETAHGLGLAIAKRVCDMQGWTLTVESSRTGPARGTCFLLRFRTNRHGCDADFTILRLWPVYTTPLSPSCALPQFCHVHSSHARAARAVQDGLSADACAGRAGAAGLPGVVDQCVRAGHDDRPYPVRPGDRRFPLHTSRWLELIGHRMVLALPIGVGLGAVGVALVASRVPAWKPARGVALAVAATCLLGQLAVSQLKHYTTLPRPYDLETLGGYTPYPLHWWTWVRARAGGALPSGHAGAATPC